MSSDHGDSDEAQLVQDEVLYPPCDELHENSESVPGNDLNDFEELKETIISDKSQRLFPCPCTDTTVDDLYVSVLTLGIRHALTWEAQVDILKLVNLIFKDKIPATKYYYRKCIDTSTNEDITRHIFCNQCDSYLEAKRPKETDKLCKNCNLKVSVNNVSNYFLSLSVKSQLKKISFRPNLCGKDLFL